MTSVRPMLVATAVALSVSFCGWGMAEETTGKDESQSIREQLAGSWKLSKGVSQGRELSEDQLDGRRVMIEKNTIITFDKEKNELYRALFLIDSSASPVEITMTTDMKDVPETKALGILRLLDDGGWELCYGLPGTPRPKKFESQKGSKHMLFGMERLE